MVMKDLSATEAARRFSQVLDSVEHRNESFRIVRGGRPVARLTPVGHANGKQVVEFLNSHSPDTAWAADLEPLRALLDGEGQSWPD
jgi:prevent-host-death family protein